MIEADLNIQKDDLFSKLQCGSLFKIFFLRKHTNTELSLPQRKMRKI